MRDERISYTKPFSFDPYRKCLTVVALVSVRKIAKHLQRHLHAPRNSTELTSHEIGVLLLREKYILDKIKEYQALPPDQMITSSVMDMRVPGGRGKRKRDGANQQIGMYQKETPAQRILQLQEALNKIHGRILSAAAQMQKKEMDKLHLETEQQQLELLRIRATGEIGEPGDGDKDAVHE